MTAEQLSHFKAITLDYFGKLSEEKKPELDEAYLQFSDPLLLDYTSVVKISGVCEGCIYMTTDKAMLESLLEVHGEAEKSERTLMDMCRELSNVLAGNAMHAFGDDWHISVPQSLGKDDFSKIELPPSTFIMPVRWNGGLSYLVLGLEQKA
jgi:hypothetical protein